MSATLTVADPPSSAVMVRVTDRSGADVDSTTGAGHAAGERRPVVVQVNETVTGARYQPVADLGSTEDTDAVRLRILAAGRSPSRRCSRPTRRTTATVWVPPAGRSWLSVADTAGQGRRVHRPCRRP